MLIPIMGATFVVFMALIVTTEADFDDSANRGSRKKGPVIIGRVAKNLVNWASTSSPCSTKISPLIAPSGPVSD